ncbi:MAG: hypothetical protein R6W06_03425 [Prochlorococcaceae cyanobacterium]
MPFFRRLFGRQRSSRGLEPSARRPAVDLVSAPLANAAPLQLPPPPPLGIRTDTSMTPWALSRVAGIFREVGRQPSEQALREARFARHCLSSFWLNAPIDQLETLYAGPLGQIYALMLDGVLTSQPLAADEEAWRDDLQERLVADFDRPQRLNLVLALMPYFPPEGMKVSEPLATLPRWFLLDYARFCDPALEEQLLQPVGLPAIGAARTGLMELEAEEPLKVPVLAEYRGAEALELVDREVFRQRMTGLLNLYRLDQQDLEILDELARLRRQLGQLWLDLVPEKLESLYRSPTGDLYRQLLSSPFTAAPLSEDDRELRNRLATQVADLNKEGALNVLLAVLPFFAPGKVELAAGQEALIPAWLLEEVQRRHA